MASMAKLSIRGVRAFSPDDEEQVIQFMFPVTVIVGANGCGKTTIIESLKYAVTGSLPPGKNSGQAFVHDPRSIGHSSVKANIKLRFTNKAGNSMVVVRSMEVTQKKTTMSFKALDGVLRTYDEDGKKTSTSQRCTELDRQIPLLLGVSKAVLENVVFCHQEDASWPLAESSVLKKRFDDIFESTRYAKALETIRKSKKEYSDKAKELKAEVNLLTGHKHAALGFRKELEQQAELLEELEQDLENCDEGIKEAEAEMKRTSAIIDQCEHIKSDIDMAETNLEKEESVLAKQRQMLEKDLTQKHSLRELKTMLRDFDSSRQQQLEAKDMLDGDVDNVRKDIDKIRQDEMTFQSQMGKVQAEKDAYEQLVQQRLSKMEWIASAYAMDLSVSQTQTTGWAGTQSTMGSEMGGTQDSVATVQVSAEDMEAFYRAIEQKSAEFNSELQQHRSESRRQEDALQKELSEMEAEQRALEKDKERIQSERDRLRDELKRLNSQVGSQRKILKSEVTEAKEKAKEYNQQLEKASQDPELPDIPIKIKSLQNKIDQVNREIQEDQEALRSLRQECDTQNEISILRQQIQRDVDALHEFIQSHSSSFARFNVHVPNPLPGKEDDPDGDLFVNTMGTVANAFREKFDVATSAWEKASGDADNKQQFVSEKSALLSHNREVLASLRQKLDALSKEDSNVTKFEREVASLKKFEVSAGVVANFDDKDPSKVVAYLTSRIEAVEASASASEAVPPEMLARVIDQLTEVANYRNPETGEVEDQLCPCCRRSFEDVAAARQFKKSMAQLKSSQSVLLQTDKEKVEKDRTAIANYQRWRKTVSECMGDVLNYTRMEGEANDLEKTVADDEKELATAEKELQDLNNNSADLKKELEELRGLADISKRWNDDASRIATSKGQVRMKEDFSVNMSMSTTLSGGRDLRTVEADLERHQAQKDKLNDQVTVINKRQTELTQRLNMFSQQARKCEEQAREKEKQYEQEQSSSKRKEELTGELERLGQEEAKIKDQLRPFKQKIEKKSKEKGNLREQTTAEDTRKSEVLSDFNSQVRELRDISEKIDKYEKSDKPDALERLNEKTAALKSRLQEKNAELAKLKPELDKVTRIIEDQERQKKIILSNIDLISAGTRVQEIKKQIEALKGELSQIAGQETCNEEYAKAHRKKSELEANKQRHHGRRTGFVETIRGLKRKLKTEEYRDIDERHRVEKIRQETTEIAVKDIQKYYDALDKALLRYHSIKIGEINKIIRELWTLTYKGQDISNIEIVSGQESGNKSKRSYDYRVVMTKGGQQLDMRGRCSAGQRVLASIVIRLALAETFCVQCGCMALDEPTVNLDWKNKKGLAIALAQIIASRAQQSNFQLIVITHDEDFVAMMKTELSTQTGFSMPEKYYQVRREEGTDNKFYSKIDSVNWDELV